MKLIAPVFQSEGITSPHTAVKSGLGLAVLPEWLAQPGINADCLVRVRAFVELAVTCMTTKLHAIR